MTEEADTIKGVRSVYLALYFAGAVLSGAGGNYLWMREIAPDVVAPDRFTGTEASSLISRIETIEKYNARQERNMDAHLVKHPDIENRYDRRIAVLESQITALLLNQERMMNKLDSLQ